MSAETDGVGRLTLDPGGTVSLRWTNAWRGLLTLHACDLRATHPLHVHDYYTISVVDSGQAEIQCRGESYRVGPGSVILISPYEVHHEASMSSAGWSSRAMNPRPATMRRVLGGEFAHALDRPAVHQSRRSGCRARRPARSPVLHSRTIAGCHHRCRRVGSSARVPEAASAARRRARPNAQGTPGSRNRAGADS